MVKNSDDSKKPQDKDTIRKIWLAGIGAYGRAVTEAKGAVDTLTGKGSDVFEELVKKGEMLEITGKGKAEELLGKGKAAVGDMKPDLDIDDRIAKMRARLSGMGESGGDRLAKRVDAMEAKLDAILAKLDADEKKPAKKTAPKKKMTTQKTTKPKPKPVPKAAAPKKGPTKKTD